MVSRVSDQEMERSSRKSKDNDRDRDRSDRDRYRDRIRDRNGDERRHRDRDRDRDGEERRHHRHRDSDDRRHRDDDDKRRHGSEADSVERDLEPRRERSADRDRVRDSAERGQSAERRHHSSSSRKRKEHDDDDALEEDRKRAKEERKERRRFEDRASEENGGEREEKGVKEEVMSDGDEKRKRREGRRFSDRGRVDEEDLDGEKAAERRRLKGSVKEEDELVGEQLVNGDRSNGDVGESSSRANVAPELLGVTSQVSMTSAAFHQPPSRQVSSITTTNENEGVSIIRSDEVTGNSSTDGTTTSVARTSGGLSLDALAKAKKALQARKEMTAKLSKLAGVQSDKKLQAASNADGQKVPMSGVVGSRNSSMSTVQATSSLAKSAVGSVTSEKASSTVGVGVIPGLNSIHNIEAVKRAQELAAKMGFHQDPEFAPLINMFPGPPAVADVAVPQRPSKAPVLRLDAQGREIDEHGNVINMPKLTNLSTLKVNINKQKKEAFQILKPDLDSDTQSNPHFDASMGINKTKLLRAKRMTFQFVEEGKWSKQAEYMKIKNQFGEAQSKELKVKQSQLAKAKAEPDDNPNLIAVPERVFRDKKKDEIPEIEWWDKPILPSGAYDDAIAEKLNVEKITIYIEHPRPIEPPAEPAPPPPQPLKLTKKEQKKLRTQRRVAKERDRQEMVRQGLLEPPKPKIKMSNLMKVLGSEATQDPTRLEMEIRSAAAEREQAHVDRNIARKLTPAERREKKERKLFEDPNTLETIVSVYRINDLSHPQTRFKVDVNAHENRLTGCAVISDGMSVVAVEGVKKSIKRYGKLMLKRINWAAAVQNDEDGAEKVDAPVNSCALVWQGSVAKPSFNKFHVHQCRSEAAARKVFVDAGVPQYWDLAANFSDELL